MSRVTAYFSATINPTLSEKFIEDYAIPSSRHPKISLDRMENELKRANEYGSFIYENEGVPMKLFLTYPPKNDREWTAIARNSAVSLEFIDFYKYSMNWRELVYNDFKIYIENQVKLIFS